MERILIFFKVKVCDTIMKERKMCLGECVECVATWFGDQEMVL